MMYPRLSIGRTMLLCANVLSITSPSYNLIDKKRPCTPMHRIRWRARCSSRSPLLIRVPFMNWSWGKYRARRCFLGRFTFDDPQFAAPARPFLIVLRVSLIQGTSSIIKRRYLFSRPAETYGRSFIDALPFPRAVIRRRASEKKVLRTGFEDPSRFAGEIPIAPLSEGSATGTRVWFSTSGRPAARMLLLGGPWWLFEPFSVSSAVAGNPLCGLLKKLFTEPPNKAGWPL